MTKTITFESKPTFLNDTKEHIMLGSYKYTPASSGVKELMEAVKQFNEKMEDLLTITPCVVYVESEEAKVKLKGKKHMINLFLNVFFAETVFLEYFDVKL